VTTFVKMVAMSSACILLASCATPSASPQAIVTEQQCKATNLHVEFVSETTPLWKSKVEQSALAANAVLSSSEFSQACASSTLQRTNGKPVAQVCHEVMCSDKQLIKLGFYSDPGTRAIAYESDGAIYLNIEQESAGSPGNLVHEFTHTLGYTHFTNWAFLGRKSVPYVVGNLVDSQIQK